MQILLTLLLTPLLAVPQPPISSQVVTSEPGQGRVTRLVVDRIQEAPAGADVRGVVAAFSSNRIANALIGASRRGVRVRVLVGSESCETRAVRRMRRALDDGSAVRCVVHAARGHRTFDGRATGLHQKSWTFSRSGPRGLVSIVTSANATAQADAHQFTDAYETVGDARLYDALQETFVEQWRDRPMARSLRTYSFGDGDRATFSPWDGPDRLDPVLRRIRALPSDGLVVRVANSAWWDTRGERIAEALAAQSRRGADVRVLASDPMSGRVRGILRRAGIPVRSAYWGPRRYHHLKLMTARYREDGRTVTRVWTGSENFSSRSRGNDELVVRLGERDTYDAYARFFDRIWRLR